MKNRTVICFLLFLFLFQTNLYGLKRKKTKKNNETTVKKSSKYNSNLLGDLESSNTRFKKSINYNELEDALSRKEIYEDENILIKLKKEHPNSLNKTIHIQSKQRNAKLEFIADNDFWQNGKTKQFYGNFELKYISDDLSRHSIKRKKNKYGETTYLAEYKEGILFDVETQDFSIIKKNLEREINFEEVKILSLVSDFKTNNQLKSQLPKSLIFKENKEEVIKSISNQKKGSTIFLFGHHENGKFIKYDTKGNIDFELSAEEVNTITKNKINLYPIGCNTASSKFEIGSTKTLNSADIANALIKAKATSKNYGEFLSEITRNDNTFDFVVKDDCFENVTVEPVIIGMPPIIASGDIFYDSQNDKFYQKTYVYTLLDSVKQASYIHKNVYHIGYYDGGICINLLSGEYIDDNFKIISHYDFLDIESKNPGNDVIIFHKSFIEERRKKIFSDELELFCYDSPSEILPIILQNEVEFYLFEYIPGLWHKAYHLDYSWEKEQIVEYYSMLSVVLKNIVFDSDLLGTSVNETFDLPGHDDSEYNIEYLLKKLTSNYPGLNFLVSDSINYRDEIILHIEIIDKNLNQFSKKLSKLLAKNHLNYPKTNKKLSSTIECNICFEEDLLELLKLKHTMEQINHYGNRHGDRLMGSLTDVFILFLVGLGSIIYWMAIKLIGHKRELIKSATITGALFPLIFVLCSLFFPDIIDMIVMRFYDIVFDMFDLLTPSPNKKI